MRRTSRGLTAGGALAALSLVVATLSMGQAPPPQPQPALMPPGTPPTLIVDLMSASGASALGAQWRVSDVKRSRRCRRFQAPRRKARRHTISTRMPAGADFDDSK